MRKADTEQGLLTEFAEFVDADPVLPSNAVDNSVLEMVGKDLNLSLWKIFTKLTLVEVAAGLATLTFCPQFGMGFGGHLTFLHALHETTPSIVFYLLCGVFFVSFAAIICGFILRPDEIQAIAKSRIIFFAIYSVTAYLVLVVLSPEIFIAGSLTWILGAMLGNVLGYDITVRMRRQLRSR